MCLTVMPSDLSTREHVDGLLVPGQVGSERSPSSVGRTQYAEEVDKQFGRGRYRRWRPHVREGGVLVQQLSSREGGVLVQQLSKQFGRGRYLRPWISCAVLAPAEVDFASAN